MVIDVKEINDITTLVKTAKWLEGKTLAEVAEKVKDDDEESRVSTKAAVGYVIEQGFFGIERNSDALPDIQHLNVEIKTCPLKYNKERTMLSVKEPLSLNIINYLEEYKSPNLSKSSIIKKNKNILLVCYIHDSEKERSEYLIKYVFLWEMDDKVLLELEPDYQKILTMIKAGRAHEIHQDQHEYLTICPKHGGTFKDPDCTKSKRKQPFSNVCAEIRAFRLKNRYMNIVISRAINKELHKGYWKE